MSAYGSATLTSMRGAQTPYERDASIADVFARQAAATPDAVAVVDASSALTYRELDERSNRFAHHLAALGIGPGRRVGVAFDRSRALPEVLLGILKAGAAYVALDPALPSERIAHAIEDAAIGLVVFAGAPCEPAGFARAQGVDIVRDAAPIAARDATRPCVRTGPSALAYVAYTSGSTGRPKGVTIPARGVIRLVRGADYVDITARDVFLQFAPLSFDASTFEIWAPLLNGARLAIAPSGTLSLAEIGRTLERFGVSTLWLTAPLFRRMVESELERFASVRQLITGGDVVSPEAAIRFLETFPACRLVDGYGPTENTTFSCCYRIASPEAIRAGVPIGAPIANSTAYVVDERLQLVAAGVTGELCVGGDGLADGYLNLPELTAERFVADPFSSEPGARMYRTGDLARVRDDGALEFLGRRDHQVKIRGFRIELGEIENVLRDHPGVVDAALSVVTQGGDKALVAHVVRAPGSGVSERDVRAHLASALPNHAVPAHVRFVAEFPTHPSGKLDREQLARLASATLTEPGSGVAAQPLARGARSRAIAACWQAALGSAAPPDVDQNFFDAGGDSLRLLVLHDRLQRELGIDFAVVELFEHVTLRKLTAFLNARVA